jgi:hypothetical protein
MSLKTLARRYLGGSPVTPPAAPAPATCTGKTAKGAPCKLSGPGGRCSFHPLKSEETVR